jgi:hypothetical protein
VQVGDHDSGLGHAAPPSAGPRCRSAAPGAGRGTTAGA